MMEVQCLRDYFVQEVVKQKNSNSKQILHPRQAFLDLKVYERVFLHMFEEQFGVETPTIMVFFKSKLLYARNYDKMLKDPELLGDVYSGFSLLSDADKAPAEIRVSEELIQMQKTLELLSKVPKPPFQGD
uniref:Uncharacterized protein n=1 Tax=Strombidium rassoulzadegani TaxID=1082188 RepID=A0A7S3CL44_9SPIT|mmetsp:Transcript_14919/g.25415  ORF Transcript_14919/g.25415 Transcript_14919/m.25415 type:complete len:130 (+) Transcript_14919:102-491(+)